MNPSRNLLIHSINHLLDRDTFRLKPDGKGNTLDHLFTEIGGEPSLVSWYPHEMGLLIIVWWGYRHDRNPRIGKPWRAQETFDTKHPLGTFRQWVPAGRCDGERHAGSRRSLVPAR